MKYKILLSYDGTAYKGWQIQPNVLTIQEILQSTLKRLVSYPVLITGSGRTDAGVHALGQIAHFSLKNPYSSSILLLKQLNKALPPDIRILSLQEVSDSFHARFNAKKKSYIYLLDCSTTPNPLLRHYRTPLPFSIDYGLLRLALDRFIGTHNFSAFANETNHKTMRNPIRTIYSASYRKEKNLLVIKFEGNGFLYKMVRNLVSTTLQIASRKLPLQEIDTLFIAKKRSLSPPPAPAQGLFLESVTYSSPK